MSKTPIQIIFLDIDGVLLNRACYSKDNPGRKAAPECVEALQHLIDQTGAMIVISSTWRAEGLMRMKDHLFEWGVKAKVLGLTPHNSHLVTGEIAKYLATTRGDEIQQWLDKDGQRYEIEAFVILDDDDDMKHLKGRLVRTEFSVGLTMENVREAMGMLTESAESRGFRELAIAIQQASDMHHE